AELPLLRDASAQRLPLQPPVEPGADPRAGGVGRVDRQRLGRRRGARHGLDAAPRPAAPLRPGVRLRVGSDERGGRRRARPGPDGDGTAGAAVIGAATNNGTGGAGITWATQVMPLRVLGWHGGTYADVVEAIRYAAGLPNASGTLPTRRADVINMSFGGGPY